MGETATPRTYSRATSFTVNGEVLEIADRPDWLVPRCDPERFKKAAAEILNDSGVTPMFHIFKDTLPEFEDAYFFQSGPVAGARETRRILGEYVLSEEDIRARRSAPDVVVLGAGRLDRHPVFPPGQHTRHVVAPYDIAFRTLLPRNVENLLVAGRCHSATSEALASSRLTATAMGMGQAAGVAAALATRASKTPRDVPIAQLQATLREQGAILERPPVAASVPRGALVGNLA